MGQLDTRAANLLAEFVGGQMKPEVFASEWHDLMADMFIAEVEGVPCARQQALCGVLLMVHEWEEDFRDLQEVYIAAQQAIDCWNN